MAYNTNFIISHNDYYEFLHKLGFLKMSGEQTNVKEICKKNFF